VYAAFLIFSNAGLSGSLPNEVPGRVGPALAATVCFIGVDPLLTGPSSLGLVVALVNSGFAAVFDESTFPTPRMSSLDFELDRTAVPVPYTTSLFLDAVLYVALPYPPKVFIRACLEEERGVVTYGSFLLLL